MTLIPAKRLHPARCLSDRPGSVFSLFLSASFLHVVAHIPASSLGASSLSLAGLHPASTNDPGANPRRLHLSRQFLAVSTLILSTDIITFQPFDSHQPTTHCNLHRLLGHEDGCLRLRPLVAGARAASLANNPLVPPKARYLQERGVFLSATAMLESGV
ncbi:hypothetical protein CORC01_03257 [Colletotrichum orchidophilum]|uniref:Uncharacterized protein n=1 Tax=Colletotrichum orchidophilum TaxID=1209926 RepID=A0A1G4BJ96_9PEZI|nr:uncharacterized protein CORC01_03257 [Colletotrichum orchidophilum]OHF01501.1 hypothetical protein CORC01_03257 [Colletotrichum orchidophilum]